MKSSLYLESVWLTSQAIPCGSASSLFSILYCSRNEVQGLKRCHVIGLWCSCVPQSANRLISAPHIRDVFIERPVIRVTLPRTPIVTGGGAASTTTKARVTSILFLTSTLKK